MVSYRRFVGKYCLLILMGLAIYILFDKIKENVFNTEKVLHPLPGIAANDVLNTNETLKPLLRKPGDDVDPACTRHFDNDMIHIVLISDKDRFIGMLTVVNSIIRNTQSDVMFHFVTFPSDVSFLKEWLNTSELRYLSYEIIEFSGEAFEGKFKVRGPRQELASPVTFVRLYLPDLLPCVGRVVYIDNDCLVLGDIRELYHIPPKDILAALNKCDYDKESNMRQMMNYSSPHVEVAGIPPEACQMNNGVLVADLLKWEQQHLSRDFEYWMELNVREPVFLYGDYGGGSQAVMNAVLHSRYTAIPKEWNSCVACMKRSATSTINGAKLLHWNGPNKPWRPSTSSDPYSLQWLKFCVPAPNKTTQTHGCFPL